MNSALNFRTTNPLYLMADRIEIKMTGNKTIARKLGLIIFQFETGDKAIRKELRKGAKPWTEAINGGVMYKHIQRDTGLSTNPIGLQTFHSKKRSEIGVKARPKRPSSKNAGWRAHFFATPARHIRRSKRVPFNSYYKSKNAVVISGVSANIKKLIRRTFLRPRI